VPFLRKWISDCDAIPGESSPEGIFKHKSSRERKKARLRRTFEYPGHVQITARGLYPKKE